MSLLAFPSPAIREPADVEARRQALDTQQSFIVEAPAGSGKTGLLIHRYLRLLTTVAQPEAVLALTFTNKATAEMRHRVLEALLSARQPLPDGAGSHEHALWATARQVLQHDAAHGWNLLAQPFRLNLRTIDSLCGEIARAVPVLSGGVGNATPLTDAEPLYREAARAVLLQLGGADQQLNGALETVLHHRDADLHDCETLIAEMLATREQWGRLVPLSRRELSDATLDEEVLPRLNAALEHVLCAALTRLHRHFPDDLLQEVATVAHLLADAEGYNDAPNPLRPCAQMPHPPDTTADDVEHWKLLAHLLLTGGGEWRKAFAVNHMGFKTTKLDKARLTEALDALRHDDLLRDLLCAVRGLPPSVYPADQWHVAKALFLVLHHALLELRLLFAAREVCDFTELAIAARTALQAGDSIAEALNLRLEHLLVDEMQDTSSAQYALLEALTAQWDGHSKTVFLVGDPKQSIYLFRQARVERFLAAMRDGCLGDIPVTPLQLTSNFRSGAALVQSFNSTFERVFDTDGPIRYTAATPALPASADDAMEWHATPLASPDDALARGADTRRARREEAETIAAFAYHWRARALPPGRTRLWKVAVLVRSRTHAAEVMLQLANAHVPFRAVEMEALGDRPEILDILGLTRALLHPADRTAWLAILRAPWCGIALADLHVLAAGDQPDNRKQALHQHLRSRAEQLADDARTRTLRVLDTLDPLLHGRGRQPLSVDVHRAWTALGGPDITDTLGRTNVRRFLELLETLEATGDAVNAASLKQKLEQLYAEPDSTPGAIEVLTIHKAKGLEWDAVLVPSLHRIGMADRAPLLDWMELPPDAEGRPQVLLAPISKRGDDAGTLNQYLRDARTEAGQAELQRLFYVAATRARTSLQLFASPAIRKDGTISPAANTLLHAAWRAVEARFTEAATALPQAEVLPFPQALPIDAPGLALAAAAEVAEVVQAPSAVLQRLPLDRLRAASPAPEHFPAPHPHGAARPQGSIAARVLGTTVHAFLQLLAAQREQTGDTRLLAEAVQRWRPRIHNLVRSHGLSRGETDRIAAETLLALDNTLHFPPGAWLLAPHLQARDEGELLDVRGATPQRFRFDRSFFAGSAPHAPGTGVLWIVDYKTSTDRDAGQPGDAREHFLARERDIYRPHLNNYARLLLQQHPPQTPVMLGLYYPLLPWLDTFAYEPEA